MSCLISVVRLCNFGIVVNLQLSSLNFTNPKGNARGHSQTTLNSIGIINFITYPFSLINFSTFGEGQGVINSQYPVNVVCEWPPAFSKSMVIFCYT